MVRGVLVVILAAAVFATAVAVVYEQHHVRKLFSELQAMQAARDALQVEWGRLQLEQSTWATDGRIERAAYGKLEMVIPGPNDVVIVKP